MTDRTDNNCRCDHDLAQGCPANPNRIYGNDGSVGLCESGDQSPWSPDGPTLRDMLDQIPIGTVVSLDRWGTGRVTREYTMPDGVRADSYWAYSHVGSRVYVVRFESGVTMSIGAGELLPQVVETAPEIQLKKAADVECTHCAFRYRDNDATGLCDPCDFNIKLRNGEA